MTSFNFVTLKALSPNAVTLRVRASIDEWRNTIQPTAPSVFGPVAAITNKHKLGGQDNRNHSLAVLKTRILSHVPS